METSIRRLNERLEFFESACICWNREAMWRLKRRPENPKLIVHLVSRLKKRNVFDHANGKKPEIADLATKKLYEGAGDRGELKCRKVHQMFKRPMKCSM